MLFIKLGTGKLLLLYRSLRISVLKRGMSQPISWHWLKACWKRRLLINMRFGDYLWISVPHSISPMTMNNWMSAACELP